MRQSLRYTSLIAASVTTLSLLAAPVYSQSIQSEEQGATEQASKEVLVKQAKERIQHFASTLKTALTGAIAEGGLENAVNVCHEQAPEIADSLSNDGWTISRTSLQTRNANNQANDWQLAVLKDFAQQHEAGKAAAELSYANKMESEFRLMKAIPTGQLCLACHGSSVSKELNKAIMEKYPSDAAKGFSLGDIRGAFVVTKELGE